MDERAPDAIEGDAPRPALRIGDWTLDPPRHRLVRGDESRALDPKDEAVLSALAAASPAALSAQELLDRCWPGVVVGDNVVHQVIARLRRAFGDAAKQPRYIETLPKRGYRLVPEISELDESALTHTKAPDASAADAGAAPATPAAAPVPASSRGRWAVTTIVTVLVLLAGFVLQSPLGRDGENAASSEAIGEVVVRPFRNLTGDAELDWVVFGLNEEVRDGIRTFSSLRLVPEALAEASDAPTSRRRIMVDGHLRRTADGMALTLELADTRDGTTTYARTFAISEDDLLAASRAIARSLADVLNDGLSPASFHGRPSNPRAYAQMLRGVAENMFGHYDRRIEAFERAVELDPTWAGGLAELSMAYRVLDAHLGDPAYAEASAEKLEAAAAVAGTAPPGALLVALAHQRGFTEGDIEALMGLGLVAGEQAEYQPLAHLLLNLGMIEEADRVLARAIPLQPGDSLLLEYRADARLELGDPAAAVAIARRLEAMQLPDSLIGRMTAARSYALGGALDDAQDRLEEFEARAAAAERGSLEARLAAQYADAVRMYIGVAENDPVPMRAMRDQALERGQMAYAGVFALLADDPRAAELLADPAGDAAARLNIWGYRMLLPAEKRSDPAFRAMLARIGYTDEVRHLLCREIVARVADGRAICDPEDHPPPG